MVERIRDWAVLILLSATAAVVIVVSIAVPWANQTESTIPSTPSKHQVIIPVQIPQVPVVTSKTPEACIGHPQMWCGVMV
jgi:hypothetical protein